MTKKNAIQSLNLSHGTPYPVYKLMSPRFVMHRDLKPDNLGFNRDAIKLVRTRGLTSMGVYKVT